MVDDLHSVVWSVQTDIGRADEFCLKRDGFVFKLHPSLCALYLYPSFDNQETTWASGTKKPATTSSTAPSSSPMRPTPKARLMLSSARLSREVPTTATYVLPPQAVLSIDSNYPQVSWLGSSILMMKTQIGLGVLSIPAAFDTLGLIPGIISLLVIGFITLWSGYIVGAFKRRHPETYGIEDVGQKLFGRAGREVLGLGFALCGSLPYGNMVLQMLCRGRVLT